MDHVKFKCFMSLAKTLSFTKTAETVYMTQQAVSRSIASLEQELGIQLFERSTRSVKISKEGRRLYEYLSRTETEYELLLEDLRRSQNPFLIRAGYQNYLSFFDRLRKARMLLSERQPQIVVDADRFTPPQLRNMLRQHELDIIVTYSRFLPEAEDYCTLPLCRVQQYYMLSDELVLPEDSALEVIKAMPFIIDRVEHESPAEQRKRIKMERERWGFTGEVNLVSDRDSAYTQAEMGRGVVVGTDLSIMSSGRALKLYNVGTPETMVAAWRRDENNPLISEYAGALQLAFGYEE